MFKFLRGIALVVTLTVTSEMAFAQNSEISANFVMPSCREFAVSPLRKSQCSGIV
jgi:hypothetical protein